MANLEKKKLAALVLVVCLGVTVAYAALQQSLTISNVGTVKTVNLTVWQDENRTIPLTSIDWGLLAPGQSKTVEAYLLSDGNTETILSIAIENWNPINASFYLAIMWDRENYTLQPKQVCLSSLTLTVDPDITGIENFSFGILLTATED